MSWGDLMIVYNDILGKLKEAGYSQHRMKKEKILSTGTMSRLHNGQSVSTETIGIICGLLNCQPCDLLTWKRDEE